MSFGLELSVLTEESVEELYSSVRGTLEERLAQLSQTEDGFSGWLARDVDGPYVAESFLAYARRCCRPLECLSADELLIDVLEDERQRSGALRGLVSLASPFLGWDETRMQPAEHPALRTYTVVGTAAGVASPLLEGLNGVPDAQVVATGERSRVSALTLVHGLPLAALGGIEEYAAAYHGADPAQLHVEHGWENLPKLSGDGRSCQASPPQSTEENAGGEQ
jgi:hypothetical protein